MQVFLPFKKADAPLHLHVPVGLYISFLDSSREQPRSWKSSGRQQPQYTAQADTGDLPAQTGQLSFNQHKFSVATTRQQYFLLEEKHCGTEGSMEEPCWAHWWLCGTIPLHQEVLGYSAAALLR